jgi:hypothetical protein
MATTPTFRRAHPLGHAVGRDQGGLEAVEAGQPSAEREQERRAQPDPVDEAHHSRLVKLIRLLLP